MEVSGKAAGYAASDALSIALASADPTALAPILAPVIASVLPVAAAATMAAAATAATPSDCSSALSIAPVIASVLPVAVAAAAAAAVAAVLASALPVAAAATLAASAALSAPAAAATTAARGTAAVTAADGVAASRGAAGSLVTAAGSPGLPPEMGPCVELLLRPRLYKGALGHSVFTVASFASADECDALIAAAERLLRSYGNRAPQPALCRLSIVSEVQPRLLRRLLALVEQTLPALGEALFGRTANLADMAVEYSPGEPAVNVYLVGGHFAPHTDKQALTLLVPLSADGAFEGGGTAFWKDGHHRLPGPPGAPAYEQGDARGWLPHDLALRPPRGSAIIFGGNVTHAGLAVTSGTRHLFVMSFSLRPRAAAAGAPAAGPPAEREAEWEREGDSAEELAALAGFAGLLGE